MIDREQAIAVFQDAVDHADWSGRKSALEAGVDAILALEKAIDRERLRSELLRSLPSIPHSAVWVDGVLSRMFDR